MWPHWGVLTVTVKAGCSIEVVSSVFGQLPVNFHAKWLLWHVQCAFRLRRLARNGVSRISVWHFPCKFPYKMALVKCPWAFRRRTLARNGVSWISVWHFPCKFPYKMALVKCPCACRLRRSTLLFLIRQIFRWFLEAHCLGSLAGIIFLARNGVCCMPENAYLDWEEGAFQIMRSLGGTKSLNRSIWRTNPFPRNMICKWCIFHIPVCGW